MTGAVALPRPAPALFGRAARNARWAVGGNLWYVATQAGVLAVIARLGSPALVGRFALALAVAAPAVLFASLQLRSAQATDVAAAHPFADYLVLRLVATGAAIAAVIAIAWVCALDVGVCAAVAVMKGAEAVSDVAYGQLQRAHRFDAVGRSLVLRGALALAAMAAGLRLTGALAPAVLAVAAAWVGVVLLVDLPAARALAADGRAADGARMWRLARASLPLGIAACVGSATASLPRYLLFGFAGDAAVGYFAALGYVVVVGTLVASALGQAVCPLLAESWTGERRRFVTLTAGVAALVAAGGLVAVGVAIEAGPRLLAALYGADYARHAGTFVWLTVAGGVAAVASVLNYALTATRRFGAVLHVQCLTAAATFAAGLVAVPAAGLHGAAVATLAGNVAGAVALVWLLVRESARA